MLTTKEKTTPSYAEFVFVISMMMALTALSIDAMLPALPQISSDLGVTNPNDRQLVVALIFLGQAVGQLFFGPLSDKTGRKPAIYGGYALFISGALISLFATSFPVLLGGRALQGIGISAPRAVSLAIVRDRFEGRLMARVMSFAMTVFILVPMIAPSIGQAIQGAAGWRSIFGSFILFALVSVIWFALRIPETLAEENRRPFSLRQIAAAMREVLGTRVALGFTMTIGLVQGVFLGYLNSSQQIFQEQYALGDLFPLIFAIISFAIGLASLLNTRLVLRYGMHALVGYALRILLVLAVLFLAVAIPFAGQPPLWSLMAYLMVSFFCVGILFGNLNALAMQPLGHLAGTGSAVVGSLSTLLSTSLGILIGRSYNGMILPFLLGMILLSAIAILVSRWAAAE